jgi:hypothetical protein
LALYADSAPQAARYFGNLASGTRFRGDDWREFASAADRLRARGDNLYEIADVWTHRQYGSLVRMSFSSPPGDWSANAGYCFGSDGALTLIESELRTFHGNMIVNRSWSFDSTGAATAGPTSYRDLRTGLPTHAKGLEGLGFQDFEIPFFKSTDKLPFWDLLSKQPAPAASQLRP